MEQGKLFLFMPIGYIERMDIIYKYTYFMNNIHKLIRKITKNGETGVSPKILH